MQVSLLQRAPVLIGVFMEKSTVSPEGSEEKLLSNGVRRNCVRIADLRIASSGLVTLTHTPSPIVFLRWIFKRPKNEKPFLLLVVGYPAENCRLPDISRKGLAGICSRVGRS